MLLGPAVHPGAALGPAAAAHAGEARRGRGDGLAYGGGGVAHLVGPVEQGEADRVVRRGLQEVASLGVVALVEGVPHVLLEQAHLRGGGRAELLDGHGEPRPRTGLVAQPRHVHAPLLGRAHTRHGIPPEEGPVAVPRVGGACGQPRLGRAVLAKGGDELLGGLREEEVHADARRAAAQARRPRHAELHAHATVARPRQRQQAVAQPRAPRRVCGGAPAGRATLAQRLRHEPEGGGRVGGELGDGGLGPRHIEQQRGVGHVEREQRPRQRRRHEAARPQQRLLDPLQVGREVQRHAVAPALARREGGAGGGVPRRGLPPRAVRVVLRVQHELVRHLIHEVEAHRVLPVAQGPPRLEAAALVERREQQHRAEAGGAAHLHVAASAAKEGLREGGLRSHLRQVAPHEVLVECHRQPQRTQRERLHAAVCDLEPHLEPAARRGAPRRQLAPHAHRTARLAAAAATLAHQRHGARVLPQRRAAVPRLELLEHAPRPARLRADGAGADGGAGGPFCQLEGEVAQVREAVGRAVEECAAPEVDLRVGERQGVREAGVGLVALAGREQLNGPALVAQPHRHLRGLQHGERRALLRRARPPPRPLEALGASRGYQRPRRPRHLAAAAPRGRLAGVGGLLEPALSQLAAAQRLVAAVHPHVARPARVGSGVRLAGVAATGRVRLLVAGAPLHHGALELGVLAGVALGGKVERRRGRQQRRERGRQRSNRAHLMRQLRAWLLLRQLGCGRWCCRGCHGGAGAHRLAL